MKQTVNVDCLMSCQSEKHKMYRKFLFINSQQKCFLVSVRLKSSLVHHRLGLFFFLFFFSSLTSIWWHMTYLLLSLSRTQSIFYGQLLWRHTGNLIVPKGLKLPDLIMPPTSKKLRGHIGLGLSVCVRPSVWVAGWVCPLRLHTVKTG